MKTIQVNGMITNNDDAGIYRNYLGITVSSPSDIIDNLPSDKSDVVIEINSGGGEVEAADEMYTALRKYPGNVTTQICSLAASAASYLAMAGDRVEISPAGKMMIHNASTTAQGNNHDMDRSSAMLQKLNETVANVYSKKCKKSINEILDLMDKETWLSPKDAIDLGLVDCEMSFDKESITMNIQNNFIGSKGIKNIKNLVIENQSLKTKLKNSQPNVDVIDKDRKLLQDKLAVLNTEDN